jgi:Cystatin domain/Cathepsin propeptide inhibitor domain (I29)
MQLSADDEDVQLYLNHALDKVNAEEDPDYVVKKVLSATRQLVSGLSYKIKAELEIDQKTVVCKFKIWEQSWLENGLDVKVTCENDKVYSYKQQPSVKYQSRKKRQVGVPGGIHESSHEDEEKVRNLLSEHLSRLVTGDSEPLTLVSIEKVRRQVVAGVKYYVDGTFKTSGGDKKCSLEIWHRAWIKGDEGTQLKADCNDGNVLKTNSIRKKRSASHHKHPFHDRHDSDHHHRDRHQHPSTSEMHFKEIKSEILFENFIKKYNRRYANDLEHKMRMRIFKKNLHKIEMLNKHEQGMCLCTLIIMSF